MWLFLGVLPFALAVSLKSPANTLLQSSRDPFPFSPGFNISAVANLAESLPSHSWEFGTASEALLELYNPDLSVFGSPFPFPPAPAYGFDASEVKALVYAKSNIVIGSGANGLSDGDGATGDPASLGVSALMLSFSPGNSIYLQAANEEVNYLLTQAPRFANGAISQRADVAELWADFVYMAPPFLAYYAALNNNLTLMQTVVEQLGLYRQVLQAPLPPSTSYAGVWQHIIGPQNQDTGLWSTGNGWAAAGMTRVLATILHSSFPKSWKNTAMNTVKEYIREILDGAMGAPADTNGLLRNYLNDTTWFGEISGSSLLASVAYRMAVLFPQSFGDEYIDWADGKRRTLGFGHVSPNGTVAPAIDPLNWGDLTPDTSGSPEGQNFVVLLYTAWRDCVFSGLCDRD